MYKCIYIWMWIVHQLLKAHYLSEMNKKSLVSKGQTLVL
jgi:hypothetical protein